MPADKHNCKHKNCDSTSESSSCDITSNKHKKHKKTEKVYCVEEDKCKKCNDPKVISKVPVIISKPGKYCVNKELVYKGCDAAITIAANNVTLDLGNNDLILRHSTATGIAVLNVREVLIKNDAIKYQPKCVEPIVCENEATGVLIRNSCKVQLEDLYIKFVSKGILIDESDDVKVINTHLENNCCYSIKSLHSKNLVLKKIHIKNNLIIGGTVEGAIVFKKTDNILLDVLNSLNGDIFFESGNNGVFKHVNILFNDDQYVNSAFQLGSGGHEEPLTASNVSLLESNIEMQVVGVDSETGSAGKAAIISNASNVHFEKVNLKSAGVEDNNEGTAVLVVGRELLANPDFENTIVVRNFKLLASNVFAPSANPVNYAIVDQPGNVPDLANEGITYDNVLIFNPNGFNKFTRASVSLSDTVLAE